MLFCLHDSANNYCSTTRYLGIEDGSVNVRLMTSGFFNQVRGIYTASEAIDIVVVLLSSDVWMKSDEKSDFKEQRTGQDYSGI